MRMFLIPAAMLIAATPGFATPKDEVPAATPDRQTGRLHSDELDPRHAGCAATR